METIRIVKRKRGAGYVWGTLLAVVILAITAWLLMDQNVVDRDRFSIYGDSIGNEYGNFRDDIDSREYAEGEKINAYISFVNREIVPTDSIEDQTTLKAATLLRMAVYEVEQGSDFYSQDRSVNKRSRIFNKRSRAITSKGTSDFADSVERAGSDPIVEEGSDPMAREGSDPMAREGSELAEQPTTDPAEQPTTDPMAQAGPDSLGPTTGAQSPEYAKESLIETGNQLVDLQKEEYPELSKMGDLLEVSLNDLKNADRAEESESLKDFFIASSSLLQEMESETRTDRFSYNKIKS